MSTHLLPLHPLTGLRAIGLRADGRPIWPIAGADGTDTAPHPVLQRLLDQRAERETFITGLLDQIDSEERDLVEAERNLLTAARERIAQLDEQIEPLEETARTVAAHRAARPQPPAPDPAGQRQNPAGQERQGLGYTEPRPHQYRSAGDFLTDLMRARGAFGTQVDRAAVGRVQSAAPNALLERAAEHQTTEEVPGLLPTPIIGQILTDLDGARPFIASFGTPQNLAQVPGKTFSRPVVTQHTATGEQEAEKDELASRQYKVEGVDFTKRTFGGWLNVSRQTIDWTSPAAWQGIVTDLQGEYASDTDDEAGADFAEGVTQSVTLSGDADEVAPWIRALYQAAAMAATGNGTQRVRALRLPNHIWVSVDAWAQLGAAIDVLRATQNAQIAAGQSSPTAFEGNILDVPRTVVPGFPAGTVIVGRNSRFEVYEQRIGLLEAVEPKVFGVEIAYGGYAAWGFLDATAFAKVTVEDAGGGEGRRAAAKTTSA